MAFAVLLQGGFRKIVIAPGVCNVDVPENPAELLRNAAGENPTPLAKRWFEYHIGFAQGYPYRDPLTVYALMRPDKITDSCEGYITVNTDEKSEQFGRTALISAEEYNALTQGEKSLYAPATVVYRTADFYEYLIPLLTQP